MSIQIEDEHGGYVAVRFYGGPARGMRVDVAMTEDQVAASGGMAVFADGTDEPTTLTAWIAEQTAAGISPRYGVPTTRMAA